MRFGKLTHRISETGLLLCVISHCIHASICVWVRERFTSSPDAFELLRFLMEALLQVGRIHEVELSFPLGRIAFRRRLFHDSLHKSFEVFPHEVTAPSYECSPSVIVIRESRQELVT